MPRSISSSRTASFSAGLLVVVVIQVGCSSSGAAQSTSPPEAVPAPPPVSKPEKNVLRHPFVIPDPGEGDRDMLVVPPQDVHPEMHVYRWHPWENGPGLGFFLHPDWPEMIPDTLRGLVPERWRQRRPQEGPDEYGAVILEESADRLRRSAERMREHAVRLEEREKRLQMHIEALNRQAGRLRENALWMRDAADRAEEQESEK